MFFQRFLRPCAAAAFLCGLTHAAFAAELTLPVEGWVVGAIPAKSDTGTSYCSMKNNYPGGTMLVFARDSTGSGSIALDFHKDMFEVGRQFPVLMQIGVVKRQATALAATKQVMIMQTGADDGFYNALKNRNKIVFNIAQKDYGFDLNASVADALTALDECASSLKSGTGFTQGNIALRERNSADDAALATYEAQEQAEQAALETAAAPQEEQAAAEPKPVAKKKKSAKKSSGPKDHSALQGDVDYLRAENEKLARENQQLAKDTSGLPDAGTPSPVKMQQQSDGQLPSSTLKDLLESAQVAPPGTVRTEGTSYKWEADDILGSAQQLVWTSGKSFSDMAHSYVQQASSLCKGQFAHKTSATKKAGRFDIIEAQMTCLDGENDAAAAVLFVNDQNKFDVITQEGTLDQLPSALFKRDAIVMAAGAN